MTVKQRAPYSASNSRTIVNIEEQKHLVRGGYGHAFEVKRGTSFRIIDIHGRQIVDMMAWVTPYPTSGEHLSMAYSRYVLGGNIPPAIGESLVTNKQEPIFKLVADDCHTHDMTFMACNPAFYKAMGLHEHRSCAENIAEAMKPWGMQSYLEATSVDPFNVFQNTPDMALKDIGSSRPGDYVEFEVLKDAVVAVSSCPYDVVRNLILAVSSCSCMYSAFSPAKLRVPLEHIVYGDQY